MTPADAKRDEREQRIKLAVEEACERGKNVFYTDNEGCEVIVRPTGHVTITQRTQ